MGSDIIMKAIFQCRITGWWFFRNKLLCWEWYWEPWDGQMGLTDSIWPRCSYTLWVPGTTFKRKSIHIRLSLFLLLHIFTDSRIGECYIAINLHTTIQRPFIFNYVRPFFRSYMYVCLCTCVKSIVRVSYV